MSLTALTSGFVVLLLSVSVVQAQSGWGVTYASLQICATKGSAVDMNCTFTYPSSISGVTKTFWFTKPDDVELKEDPNYDGRVHYQCDEKNCTLKITGLRESDSLARYWFRFLTTSATGKYSGKPGVTLSVTALQMQVTRVNVNQSYTEAALTCHSRCNPPSYVWFKNGQKVPEEASSYTGHFNPGDSISCALKGHEDCPTPSLYAPKVPSVSVNHSGEIVEGSSVTLNCSRDANVANYTWYKNPKHELLSDESQLVFSSIQSSDSGEYYCAADNELGRRTSDYISINVHYAPKMSSVSVSPSGEIVEGSSVNLTCSSDANPAAKYTWYKENQTLLQGAEGSYHFTSISSEDSGIYYCKSENQYGQITSSSLFIDVQYAPKLPSVSACHSAEIEEGSSVTLTCSSDANPAAKYTWYKENEDSPKATGQIFIITDFRAEHSGNYYCEVQNIRGSNRSILQLTVWSGKWKAIAAGTVAAISIVVILIFALLWIRKKRGPKKPSEPKGIPDKATQKQPAEQKDSLHYASVRFSQKQADHIYSNTTPALAQEHKSEEKVDRVVYATVKFDSGSTAPG